MNTKIYQVDGIHGSTLVRARTKAGAIRAVVDSVKANASCDIATPDAIYAAGRSGVAILGDEPQQGGGDLINSEEETHD